MIEYDLENFEFIPLCDLLKKVGLCESGGQAKLAIAAGEVVVDGQVELRKRFKVRRNHRIEFAGELVVIN